MIEKAAVQSVIYVLDDTLALDIHERALHRAQQFALDAKLPFAVVGVLEDDERARLRGTELGTAESLLQRYDIPLILLVGNRGNALKGFSAHVSSLMIMQDREVAADGPTKHPYPWPGHIEGVASVVKMVQSNPGMCRF